MLVRNAGILLLPLLTSCDLHENPTLGLVREFEDNLLTVEILIRVLMSKASLSGVVVHILLFF